MPVVDVDVDEVVAVGMIGAVVVVRGGGGCSHTNNTANSCRLVALRASGLG